MHSGFAVTRFILCTIFIGVLFGSAHALPNQRAVGLKNDDGTVYLQNWSPKAAAHADMKGRYVPDNPAFRGAESWISNVYDADLKRASIKAFTDAGMKAP